MLNILKTYFKIYDSILFKIYYSICKNIIEDNVYVRLYRRESEESGAVRLTEIRSNVAFKHVHRSRRLSITTIKPAPAALRLMETHAHVLLLSP